MCNPAADISDAVSHAGSVVSDTVSDIGNQVADVWHDVSAPVVDSQLGRTGLTALGGWLGGPWGAAGVNAALGANDLATGKGQNTVGNFVRGLTGFYAGAPTDMAPTGIDTGAVDLSGSGLEDLTQLGNAPSAAIPTAGSFSLPDVQSTQAFTDLSGTLGTGLSGTELPIEPTAMVTQGGMNPVPTVGQGGELTYSPPSGMGDSSGFSLSDLTSGYKDVDNWLKENVGMGAAKVGTGLYDMYRKNQAADMLGKQAQQVQRQASSLQSNLNVIQSMYAPGSPEYEMLAQEIARRDAKAGRNSQYGQRAVELAAKINALKNQQYAPGLQALTSMTTNANNLNSGAAALRSGSLNTLGTNWTLANLPK